MKISKYYTATGTNPEDLDRSVNSMMQKGYQPYGNPYDIEEGPIAQAMVKLEEPPPPPPPPAPAVS